MGSVDDRLDPVSAIYLIGKISHPLSKSIRDAALDLGKGRIQLCSHN